MATVNPSQNRWLTCREVGQMLGVSTRTIWRLSASGRIPKPIRLGVKSPRWRESTLINYLDGLAGNGGGK